ncbi:hypothetical protein [uncultured Brevundimonas sp.]|uniref:hypothetical protein n=1 Tax=uncultured Brevundimonas sp. TaxID=213418 RepID=UPI0026339EC4|nr:hypothetical protein [uncultured Brevundimonas sp.]
MSGEPGSPLLAPADGGQPIERFAHVDELADRLHHLRQGRGLSCTPGAATLDGGDYFPGVLVWVAPTRGADPAAARFLAFAAGPGAHAPAALLAALARTRPSPSRKAA